MTKKSGSGKVEEFMGQPVSPAIDYTFEYDVYENITEAKGSEDWLSDAQVLKTVNRNAETRAKAASYQKAVATLRETFENSREGKIKNIVDAMVKAGIDKATAQGLAESQVPA